MEFVKEIEKAIFKFIVLMGFLLGWFAVGLAHIWVCIQTKSEINMNPLTLILKGITIAGVAWMVIPLLQAISEWKCKKKTKKKTQKKKQ